MENKKVESREAVSILTYETVNIKTGKIREKPRVVYNHTGNILLELEGRASQLFVDVSFNPSKLSKQENDSTFKANFVYLRNEKPVSKTEHLIPLWLIGFKEIKTLQIENIDLGNLSILKNISIKNLILSNARIKDMKAVLKDIITHKELRNLVYGPSFAKNDLEFLQKELPNLKLMQETEYQVEAKRGNKDFINEWI